MKLGIYEIINTPLPKLYKQREIIVNEEDFKYEDEIVKILNKHLKMDKLSSEHFYAVSLTTSLYPKGILQLNIGSFNETIINKRDLAIGLLLTGAERFYIFHNHPGYEKKPSNEDIKITNEVQNLSNIIGVDFDKHIVITKNHYEECKLKEKLPFS